MRSSFQTTEYYAAMATVLLAALVAAVPPPPARWPIQLSPEWLAGAAAAVLNALKVARALAKKSRMATLGESAFLRLSGELQALVVGQGAVILLWARCGLAPKPAILLFAANAAVYIVSRGYAKQVAPVR